MNERTRVVLQLAILVGICAFLFFYGMGAFGLVGADEPRYAQIAREMFNRHDWIIPTLNGQPWLEKPALLYWKIMNSYAVLGVHDWAARVPAAFHATVLVVVVFFFMRRFRPGAEMDAALVTASSAAVIGFARGASTDMLLAGPFSIAMLCWWAWHQTQRKLWLGVFYAMLALGALAKGPVAPALAILIVAAYALIRRDLKAFLRSLWWPGFLLFFVIALPWYVAVATKVPQFFRIFFIEHNVARFATNLYRHSQPFWYYIPVFVLSALPWTVFTIGAVVQAGKNAVRQWRQRAAISSEDRNMQVFLLVWILIPLLFFSVSRSKLPGYILPTIPAAAVLTADYLHRQMRLLPRWITLLHALICGLLVAGALLAPWLMLKVQPSGSVRIAVIVGAGVTAIVVLLLLWLGGSRWLRFATLVPVIVALAFLLGPAAVVIDQVNSARPVDEQLHKLGAPSVPIAVFDVKRELEYGLNFYRNQPIQRYERNEIPEPSHLLIAKEGSAGAVLALLGPRQLSKIGDFPPQHLEFYLVAKR